MKNSSKIMWGFLLIIIGVIIGLNSLGFTDINLFFNGWWTFFIIIPCFIGLFNKNEGKTGNFIGLVIGVALFLASQDILNFEIIAKLIVPFILIMIGLSFIFNNTIKRNVSEKISSKKKDGLESIVATFGSQKISKENEKFEGCTIDSVFGGVFLDLRGSKIEDEAVIQISSIFGGVEIIIPEDVNVKVKSTPIFGGVSNTTRNIKDSKKTIYIEALCMFGGVTIK